MTIHLSGACPIGSWIDDGSHTPFHALACPLRVKTYEYSVESLLESARSHRAHRA